MRYGSSADAPTHLSHHQLPPEWLDTDDDLNEVITSAVRGGRNIATRASSASLFPRPPRPPTEPASVPSPFSDFGEEEAPYRTPVERSKRAGTVRPAEAAGRDRSKSKSESESEKRESKREKRESKSKSRSESKSRSRSESAAPLPAAPPTPEPAPAATPAPTPAAQAGPALQLPPGVGAIDPLAVPIPPELAPTIFGWVRRIALQSDLKGADKMLREALLDLTSSLSIAIVYPGPEGLWTLGEDDELPKDAQPLVAVATARQAIVTTHSAIIPVLTASETVAVVTLNRNPRNPAYHPIEHIAMIALLRESAAILHHLAINHLQRTAEINADKGGLYRGEALEAHRSRGHEGVPVSLSPFWVRRAYPMLVAMILIALVVTIFLSVPTYSTGQGMVVLPGQTTTSPAMGTADEVMIEPGKVVAAGQVMVRLHSSDQAAELQLALTQLKNAKMHYLQEQADEGAKKALSEAAARVERAQAAVDARVIRARRGGVVADVRVRVGQAVNVGDFIATIVDPGTEPEVMALLPGSDLPRLRIGQTLQLQLDGYKKVPLEATVTAVGNEVIGAEAAMRYVGQQQADQFKLQGGNYVIVRAKLPSRTFETEHRTYYFHHGMIGQTEVKVASKPFLVSLIPALEKYIPD